MFCWQYTMRQRHFFCWPDNSFCHANHSVLQVEEVTSSWSSFFIISLSNPLNLSLFLGVFTVLPFQIWRTLASHRMVYTQENTNCLKSLLCNPCTPEEILYHELTVRIVAATGLGQDSFHFV